MSYRKRKLIADRLKHFHRAGSPLGRGHLKRYSQSIGAEATGSQAIGALAVGPMLVGALAIGALAIGALAIGRLTIGRARLRRVVIDELVVRKLRITEQMQLPERGTKSSAAAPHRAAPDEARDRSPAKESLPTDR